ncbi:hypothetical protein H2198_008545 [Neophaeococcomyces mojaviensis]|uniref:Uncharacterized protein n=1 Tax=Neophaeococcomyces mojaviensis TaxID=3383035 RepID=A0ACC2ZWX2_9EURO|nr:hypothetical protein H2198_008545 [Knufia sp. JES_112]
MPGWKIQRSFYDPSRDHGAWSPTTAVANFCEEDYQFYYVGEFVNTISNLAYIYFALYPTSSALNRMFSQQSSTRNHLSTRRDGSVIWDFHTISLLLVGMTSGLFHATLHALPQWLDETSMYLLAGSFAWSVLTTKYITVPSSNKDKPHRAQRIAHHDRRLVALGLILLLSITSLISMHTGNLAVHSWTFAILIVSSGIKLIYLIFKFQPAPPLSGKTSFLGFPVTIAQRKMLLSLVKADMLLNLAFALWLVDCNPTFCGYLRYLRNEVLGASGVMRLVGFVTELHGWWHFLTAAAAGEYIGLLRSLTTQVEA